MRKLICCLACAAALAVKTEQRKPFVELNVVQEAGFVAVMLKLDRVEKAGGMFDE